MLVEELRAEGGHVCADNCAFSHDEQRVGERELPDGRIVTYTYMVSIYICNICSAEFEM